MRSKSNLVSATAMLVVLGLFRSTLVANVNEGIISHWRFDEGWGTIAYDSAGTNDGTVYGAMWTTGQINGALSFDGVDDYVDAGDPIDESLDFGASDSFSISAWIRTNMDSPIVYKRKCGGTGGVYYEGYGFQLWSLKLHFAIEDTGGRNAGIFGNTMVADDRWHHVVAVRDLGEDKLYLYADGSSDAAPVPDATTGTLATSRSFHIGRRDATVSPGYLYCEGKMDDVRIYDRALSAAEIMELYTPSDMGPIAHWKFDEGHGTMAYDSAGDNDGTIYGATWTTGQIDGALSFDGVDDYVQLPAGAADLGLEYATQSFTIEMWLKTIQTEERYLLDNYRYTLGNISFRIDAGKIEWHIGKYRIGNYILFRSEASVNDGLWHHVACTWDGAGEASIFVDGNSSGSSTNPNLVGSLESGYPFLIGTRIESSGLPERFFRGTIDEVAIYQRALTAEEVWEIYMSYLTEPRAIDIKPGSCPNPLNTKSHGVLPVAVLGSEDFDVNTIDIASIRLAGVAPIRSSFEDVAAPVSDVNECACSTEGPDGLPDLTLKFETQKIVEAIGEVDHGDELVLQLTGVLSDETHIEGSDCIVIRGRHKPLNRADFNGDGTVDMTDFAAFAENWLQSSIVEY